MEYAIIPRSASLLTYPDHPLRFASSCQITQLTDDRASIHSLHGADFYELLKSKGLEPFQKLGIRIVEVAVEALHLRLIRIALRRVAKVTDTGPTTIHGHPLRWIVIEATQY